MAAQGWFWRSGGLTSVVFAGESRQRCATVSSIRTRFFRGDGPAEEQVAVYEDCGWKYVTSSGLIHVFSSPAGSDAPEFYADPAQQALTLRALRRQYIWAWVR